MNSNLGSISDMGHLKSYDEKKANDFQFVKDAFEIYDRSMSIPIEEKRRMMLKANLAIGEMPPLNQLDLRRMDIRMSPFASKKSFNSIPHHKIINTIVDEHMGKRQRMSFEPMCFDISLFSRSEKSRMHLEYLQNYLSEMIYKPYQDQVTREYMMQYGIADITQLSHEQQQQMQADISARVKDMPPEKINEYFDKEYYSAFSEQAQGLIEYESKDKNLKRHFEERFRSLYVHNCEASFIYPEYNSPMIDVMDMMNFRWEGSDNVYRYELGDVGCYEVNRTWMDIFNKYGNKISIDDIKKFDMSVVNGTKDTVYPSNNMSGVMEEKVIAFWSEGGGAQYFPDGIDKNTPEGQEKIRLIKEKFGSNGGGYGIRSGAKVRDCFIAFRTPVSMVQVERVVNGRREYSWFDGSYQLNPDFGDVAMKRIRGTRIMQCRKIGHGTKGVYIDYGPAEYQWIDPDKPNTAKLPFFGGVFRQTSGKGKSRGYFDNGLQYQIDFNIEAARLEEEKSFNIGKVFTMFMSMKPDDYEWDQYIDLIRGTRIAPIDEEKLIKSSVAQAMASGGHLFKAVDMTNQPAIAEALQQLSVIYEYMKKAMGNDQASVNPYASTETNKQKLSISQDKTLDIYTIHSEYMNYTLQAYMDFAHHMYRNNPRPLSWVMDDMSVAELNLSDDFLQYGKMGVFIANDADEQNILRELKLDVMAFIQNPAAYHMILDYSRFKLAKTPAQLLNVAEAMSKSAKEQAMQASQIQEEQMKYAEAVKQKTLQDARDQEVRIKQMDVSGKYDTALLGSLEMMKANDVDQDNQNDINEREKDKIKSAEKEAQRDREFELKKQKIDNEVKLIIEKMKAQSKKSVTGGSKSSKKK